jgi:hypothetical protein
VDRVTGRELLAALDEELDKLTPRYREPLVLCYLEGLTRDEAAVQLGVPAATLKVQLERGRKRLGDALTRRGFALGAGLLAFAATSPAGATPSRLVESVLAAASGSPSAAVAALAKGVAVNGLVNKLVLLGLALVGAAAMGVGLGSASLIVAGQQPDKAEPTVATVPSKERGGGAKATSPAENETIVSGRVLAPDGKPVPSATVYLFGRQKDRTPSNPVPVATTDGDGRFTYDPTQTPPGLIGPALVAVAKGFAPDWGLLSESGPELTLRLAPEVPVRGRLLDLEGKPVAGAVVKVVALGAFTDGNLQPAFNAMRLNPEWLNFEKNITPFAPAFTMETKTTADGRFELTGIGTDRVAVLRFEASGIEAARVHIVTRLDFDPQAVLPSPHERGQGFVPGLRLAVYGPTFTHAAQPSHDIIGTVTDAATEKPVANVTVVGSAGYEYVTGEPFWDNSVEAKTGRDGRFRLSGLPKASRRFLHLQPGDNPFLDRLVEVKDVEGLAPVSADVKLERCVVIEGRITDKVTGKPVKGQVLYLPRKDNLELANSVEARLYQGSLFSAYPTGTRELTDDAGKFKLRVPRGPGLVLARVDTDHNPAACYTALRVAEEDRKYLRKPDPGAINARLPKMAKIRDRSEDDEAFDTGMLRWPLRWENGYALINPGAKDDPVQLNLRLDPGQTVSGKVVGPDGQAVAGAKAAGVQATNEHKPTTFRGDTFTAYALAPDRTREIFFLHEQKKLAGTITVRTGDKESVVKLQPWAAIAGRVLNPDGTPATNADIHFQLIDGLAHELIRQILYPDKHRGARTDKEGRFRLEGMFPSLEVHVFANTPGFRFGMGSQPVIPKPGETVDVGDIKLPSSRE